MSERMSDLRNRIIEAFDRELDERRAAHAWKHEVHEHAFLSVHSGTLEKRSRIGACTSEWTSHSRTRRSKRCVMREVANLRESTTSRIYPVQGLLNRTLASQPHSLD